MSNILITGSNRGLGLEFVRQTLVRGDRVIAGYRNPKKLLELYQLSDQYSDQLILLKLDVTQKENIELAFDQITFSAKGLDILINNAGIQSDRDFLPQLNADDLLRIFHVNAIAPIILAQKCLPLLKSRPHFTKIINITSMMGSLQLRSGDYYGYRASKAALNMFSRALAYDVRSERIIVITLHPGWVRTGMGGNQAPLSPEESVKGMLKVIDGLSLQDTGKFFTWEGKEYFC